jgi:hypothetical protein
MRMVRLWAAGWVAGALLGLAAGAAFARSFEFPIVERGIRAVWAPLEIVTPFNTIRCNTTIEGSFHARTFAKTERSLIGHITRASVSGCSATVLTETLPWHVTYGSFAGTLPNITRVTLFVGGMAMSAREPFGSTCLLRSSSTSPVKLIGDTALWEEELELEGWGYIVPNLRSEEASRIPLTGTGFCTGAEASFRGTATTTGINTTRKIRLGLMGIAIVEPEAGEEATEQIDRIREWIRNGDPPAGQRIRINEIILYGTNPERYAIEDPNRCEYRRIPPGHLCSFWVERLEAGGEAEMRIETNRGILGPKNIR